MAQLLEFLVVKDLVEWRLVHIAKRLWLIKPAARVHIAIGPNVRLKPGIETVPCLAGHRS